jgi:Tfp pilus assembly protein PilF
MRKLVSRYNKLVDPSAESLWLALRVERKSARVAEASVNQLRRRSRFARIPAMQRGEYD